MRTVFVIGAGANVEIGMPSGDELKKEIVKKLDFKSTTDGGDNHLYNVFVSAFGNHRRLSAIAETIREALPFAISIDNFLDAHRNETDVVLGGKLAIIVSILEAERKSSLYNFIYDDFNNIIQDTWYPLFLRKITEGCEINEFIERLEDISFIIFNYDRCFEYYMPKALRIYYQIGQAQAESIVEKMKIIHPYGIIGNTNNLGGSIPLVKLVQYAQNIRTFTEYSEETREEQTSIKHIIDRASRVIFLGFAYHRLNLGLLFDYPGGAVTLVDKAPLSAVVECYGTGYGISEGDRKYIQDFFKKLDTRIGYSDISGDTCTQFFNNFWYRLYFGKSRIS